ncbi:MAG: ATP-grasp domain-containing protein, partial [Deltaproteobacteria bacterium]|nr:ATP-grasp domain-containing protein [Deltaproteobacteria bacterium]
MDRRGEAKRAAMERRFNRVAVLMGGPSAERDVSLCSGRAVAEGLTTAGYDVVEVQELLDRRGLPYTGSGPESSRLSFDKVASKRCFDRHGIPTPPYEVLRAGDSRTRPLPAVVKPARQGSSIGLQKVCDEEQWPEAFAEALSYDEEVLVEDYVAGRELTVGVLEGQPLPVIEIAAPETGYDYRAKYTSGLCEYRVPAPLGEGMKNALQAAGARTYEVLGCRGF